MQPKDFKKIEEQYKIGGKSDFMKLEEGDNIVRIVSEFEVRGVHQFKNEKGKFESRICVGKEKGCIYCGYDNKITVKYLTWVFDIKDNLLKLLEIGHTIFKQLGVLQEDPDYSFEGIPNYNVKIRRTGKGLETEYQVIASPKRYELTSEQEELVMAAKPITQIIEAMKNKELETQSQSVKVEEEVNIEDVPF